MPALLPRWTRLLALLGAFVCAPAWAVEELELKAAIVFNLLLFVEWPADALPAAGGSMALCVSPASVLSAPLKRLQGRQVHDRPLEVRDLPAGTSWAACQAVYVDEGEAANLLRAAKRGPGSATLVICDDMAAAPASAAIVLRRLGSRMGFDVNLEVARLAHLQFSSKLLRLAREVKE